jgi:solute carrier family 24 (sodium/potassium/calcium exchanger), member 6
VIAPSRHGKKDYRAARAFFLTLLLFTCLGTYALFATNDAPTYNALARRDELSTFTSDEEQCRLVHRAHDQCAFIHAQCPTDEGGFTAYLSLYFCSMRHVKPIAFILLILWLALLFSTIGIAASDFFCINLNTIASILGMSESMAGVTFLAFGNGSPDVFSTFAAMSTNSGNLAVGELFGAAGFITAVVAGSMALIKPFKVSRKSFIRDVGFFVFAAAFSIVFLWDGKLHLWECLTMVGFYICYVLFVVAWHWWIGRRRRRREAEAAARGHFIAPGEESEDEEYHDEPDEAVGSRRPSMIRGVSIDDWSALERGGQADGAEDEDEEEEARDRWMSDLATNMRLTRPAVRSRKNTLSTVRPSLVGALEFQAVLKSLQKSRNIQTIPLHARRYSDDPSFTTAQQQDHMSSLSDPAARPPYQVTIDGSGSPAVERPGLDVPKTAPARSRAISANGADELQFDPSLRPGSNAPSRDENLIDVSDFGTRPQRQRSHLDVPGRIQASQPPSPSLEVSAASPRPASPLRLDTSMPGQSPVSPGRLAPPSATAGGIFRPSEDQFAPRSMMRVGIDSPMDSPRTVPSAKHLPRIHIPVEGRSRDSSRDSSPMPPRPRRVSPASPQLPDLVLPPSVSSPESVPMSQDVEQESPNRPNLLTKYWPYRILPPPGVIFETLFPTIFHWREKNWWEKCLSIVAAPSVFMLTITLPVVENEKDKDDDSAAGPKNHSFDTSRSKSISGAPAQSAAGLKGVSHEEITEEEPTTPGMHRHSLATPGGGLGLAVMAAENEQHHRERYHDDPSERPTIAIDQPAVLPSPAAIDPPQNFHANDAENGPELWNRWLTIIQLFLAPIFIVFAIYTQSPADLEPRWLIKPILISLLVSVVLLITLLLTSTPTHRPRSYRSILSLAGFVVSIAWISTIASQVVGALKALAVILNMSHAIMGLTIFAVGNSLGDLVADVTVARLGYPVMALSACFGGPMLNILLGIGLSGSYILIRGAQKMHSKHPDKDFKFKPYHIEVSNTLIVSGATLLVTLVGLLIIVPLNRWTMSKRIGWTLIAVWTLSTVGNCVLEWTGWAKEE